MPLCLFIAFILIVLLSIPFLHITWPRPITYFTKNSGKLIIAATVIFLIFQIFVSWSSYFLTGWDVKVLINSAYKIANGIPGLLKDSYFSRYPNNMFIEFLFVMIFRFAKLVGVTSLSHGVFFIIILQCILSSLSGYLIFQTLKNITGRFSLSWLGWGFYVLLIGTSPWVMIPYSDSMCLIFPILIIWLWSTIKNTEKHILIKWIFIAAFTFLGYKIKPQTVIVFIAIVIIEFLHTSFSKFNWKHFLKAMVSMMATVIVIHFVISGLTSTLPFQVDKNLSFGMSHFLMLGLNEKSEGRFSADDVRLSLSCPTTKERTKTNLAEAGRRIKNLGIAGTLRLAAVKTCSNYGNGVFGWSQEGGQYFYKTTFKDTTFLSPLLKDTLYMNGRSYRIFAVTKQILWFGILILSLFSLTNKDRESHKKLLCVALSIIGITIFELIFEARARYLYSYTPLYVVLAMAGWQNLIFKIKSYH